MKRLILVCALFLLQSALNLGYAQVQFQATPVANACPYPWVLVLNPVPTDTLAPGVSRVLTRIVTFIAGPAPYGNYLPAVARVIQVGDFCFFENCTPASILLTCAPVSADGKTITVEFKHKDKEEAPKAK